VREHLGARYGCLTAILDMLKVAIPVLVFALYWPDEPYRLIVAGAGIVGHVWPLYYRFVGGRGLSPILGGLLIIDPLGLIINTVAAFVLGILGGSLLFLRWGWLILLIPWFWLTTRDPATVAYMVVANAVYWFAMLPELRQYMALKRRGVARNKEEISRAWSMGGRIGRLADRYSLPALWRRWRGRASPTASRPDR
jgi:glycerol-3-phosphate acyltransferase PlsY